MSTRLRIILGIIGIAVVGAGAFLWATRPVAAPSATPSQQTEATPPAPDTSTDIEKSTVQEYLINSDQSKAQFEIDEVLNGKPFRVVGETNQVIGEIDLDMKNPAASTISEIRVNARTLKTDSPKRDGAVGRFILQSEKAENEFIVFAPTSIIGMPDVIVAGQPMNLKITGQLTIKGMTKEVVFDATTTLTEAGDLTGTAQTTVNYKDFNLTIPNVPFVASVEESVTLKINLVAHELQEK